MNYLYYLLVAFLFKHELNFVHVNLASCDICCFCSYPCLTIKFTISLLSIVYLFHAILKFDNEKEQRTFTRHIYLIIGVVFSFPKENGNHDKSLIQVMTVHNRK
jgi:hypothetical protein